MAFFPHSLYPDRRVPDDLYDCMTVYVVSSDGIHPIVVWCYSLAPPADTVNVSECFGSAPLIIVFFIFVFTLHLEETAC